MSSQQFGKWKYRDLLCQNPSACKQDFDVETHSVKLIDTCNPRGIVDKIESSKRLHQGHCDNLTHLWDLGVGQSSKMSDKC